MMSATSVRPLTQGVDYDAKIAIYKAPFILASELASVPLSTHLFSSRLGIPVAPGEAMACVHIWSEIGNVNSPDENTTETWTESPNDQSPYARVEYKFPTKYPLNRLLQGREGDVIEVPYGKRTYRFLCAQKEANDCAVSSTRSFQDTIAAKKQADAWSRSSNTKCSIRDFDFSKYLIEFLETHVPKITDAPKEISPEFESISTQKAEEVFRQFKIAVEENSLTLPPFCDQLRKRLIEKQEPDLWYDLHQFAKAHKDRHASLKELFDVCVALANYRPDISQHYAEANSIDKLELLQTTGELKEKIDEAKSLNCQIIVRRIKQILGL